MSDHVMGNILITLQKTYILHGYNNSKNRADHFTAPMAGYFQNTCPRLIKVSIYLSMKLKMRTFQVCKTMLALSLALPVSLQSSLLDGCKDVSLQVTFLMSTKMVVTTTIQNVNVLSATLCSSHSLYEQFVCVPLPFWITK